MLPKLPIDDIGKHYEELQKIKVAMKKAYLLEQYRICCVGLTLSVFATFGANHL
ncbi:hypothetical protein [Helicobacter bizzozeronii]|uniref:hypothetical protein n=1 Tax=Helicobacter bizzozeronii TaxID=56877 RepID=UPI001314FF4F|nr:hypothetical protein [Helicobacter bizzozeronii]